MSLAEQGIGNLPAFTAFMSFGTLSVFLGTSGTYLWEAYSPAIPILAGWLVLMSILFLIRAWGTDPGILPRATQSEGDSLRGTSRPANCAPTPPIAQR